MTIPASDTRVSNGESNNKSERPVKVAWTAPYLKGTLVALVGFLLIALPFAGSALSAAIWLGGCTESGGGPVPSQHGMFGPCPEPDRLKGTLAALVALVLFALPVIAGVLTARAVSRPPESSRALKLLAWALKILALVVLLGMAVLCIISVIIQVTNYFRFLKNP